MNHTQYGSFDTSARGQSHWLALPALCFSSALAYLVPSAQPIWVAAFIKQSVLSTSEVGWLASGELFMLAMGTLLVSVSKLKVNVRVLAAGAATLLATFNAIAMYPSLPTIVSGRLLSGLAAGALLTAVTRVAVGRRDSQRVLALVYTTLVLLLSALYLAFPLILSRYGPTGLFGILAALGALAALLTFWGLPDRTEEHTDLTRHASAPTLAPILGCLGLASMAAGAHTMSTYMVTIANGLGFDLRTMATVFAISVPLAILGPLAATFLGERAGVLRPLLLVLLLIDINFFFIVSAASPVLFGMYAAAQGVMVGFCVPYGIASVGHLDPTGRVASVAPTFMMIGSAIGPKLGSGLLVHFANVQAFAMAAGLCIALSIVLFATSTGLGGSRACSRPA